MSIKWFAYERKDNGEMGFMTDDSQGFAAALTNPNLIVTEISQKPTIDKYFDTVTKTLKTKPV